MWSVAGLGAGMFVPLNMFFRDCFFALFKSMLNAAGENCWIKGQ